MTLFTSAALKVRPERPVRSEPPPLPSCRRRRRPLTPGHSPRRAAAAANCAAAPSSHRLRISTTISVGGNLAHAAGSERPPSLCDAAMHALSMCAAAIRAAEITWPELRAERQFQLLAQRAGGGRTAGARVHLTTVRLHIRL